MTRLGALAAILANAGCTGISAYGAPPPTDQSDIQAWFQSEWDAAARDYDLSGVKIRWRVDGLKVPPADEIARLRESVKGRPDHPEKGYLELIERRLRGEDLATRIQLWWLSDSEWRVSEDDGQGGYWDRACTRGTCWSVTRDQLNIVSLARRPTGFDVHYDASPTIASTKLDARLFLTGGLHSVAAMGSKVPILTRSDDGWVARCSGRTNDLDCSIRVERPSTQDRWHITEVEIRVHGGSRPAGMWSCRSSDWQYDEVIARWVASKIVETDSVTGVRTLVFDDAAAFSVEEGRMMFAVPDHQRADAVRGQWSFASVRDLREGAARYTQRSEKGFVGVEPGATPAERSRRMLRYTGWVVAALGVLGVLAWKWRSHLSRTA